MGLKRKRFRCGWGKLWGFAGCMVEIGRVRVKTGNAPIEQKISAYPPQADIRAFVSTSLETKRAARRPSQGSGRPNANGSGWLGVAVETRISPRPPHSSRRALLTHRSPVSGPTSCDERFSHALARRA